MLAGTRRINRVGIKFAGILLALVALALVAFAPLARADALAAPYIVTFAPGVSDDAARSVLSAAGGTVDSHIGALRMYSATLPVGASDVVAAAAGVTRVEVDRSREQAGVPNDTDYGTQWALPRIGWDQVYGAVDPSGSAKVAVLDTGVDASEPELADKVVAGTSILDGSAGTSDPNGHGTAMASIVAAKTNNASEIAGVGYAGVSVMPVTVLGSDGTGQDSDIIQGVVYAANHGADVILMAFSSPGYSESLQAAIDYAWSQGAVLVAATGNDASSVPTFPAGDRGVIGVASTGMSDSLSPSSNYGTDTFLAAPGEGIASVNGMINGTSASAAIVAGAAALLKAASAGATNGVIVGRLARNADPAGTNFETGNGRVNLARAMGDSSGESVQPAGAAPIGNGGPYVAAANNDAHVAPGWAATNTTVTFSSLYRPTTGGTVQHVRITLPVGYTNISVAATAFSSGTWSTPVVNQVARTIDVQLTSGTGLAINDGLGPDRRHGNDASGRRRAETPRSGLMETFTNTAGTSGEQDDNPPVLIGDITNPSAAITFVDAGGNPITNPVLQNGVSGTVRVRITQTGGGIKYTDVAVPTCFSSPTNVTTTLSAGGNPYVAAIVTDGFIRLSSGTIATQRLSYRAVQHDAQLRVGHLPRLLGSEHQRLESALGNEPVGLDDRRVADGRGRPCRPLHHEDRLARPGRPGRHADLHDRREQRRAGSSVSGQGRRHAARGHDFRQRYRHRLELRPRVGHRDVQPDGRESADGWRAEYHHHRPRASDRQLDHEQRDGLVAERQHPRQQHGDGDDRDPKRAGHEVPGRERQRHSRVERRRHDRG